MTSLVERWLNDKNPAGIDHSVRYHIPEEYKGIRHITLEEAEKHMREAYYNSDAGKARLKREQEVSKRIA